MNDRCPSCVQIAKYVGFCPAERDELTTALAQSVAVYGNEVGGDAFVSCSEDW